MELNRETIFGAIEQIAEQNLLTKEETIEIIKDAVFKTFHSKFDPDAELEMSIDPETGKFELVNKTKFVTSDEEFNPEYKAIEIPLSEAKKQKADVEEGDVLSEEVNFAEFAKRFSNQVRQIMTQGIREKKKAAVYAKHKSLKGEMVSAVVTSSTSSYVILELEDGTTAFMPSKLRNLNIPLNIGETTKVFVEDVLEESKDSQIVVSNGSPTMIKRLLESEVPEIMDGTVEVMGISRIAGLRSKVAVKSNNPEVDAVGAIIGAGGSRIKSIIEKLEGEKLDVINYSEDSNTLVMNAISPAKVVYITDKKDEEGNVVEGHKVIVTPNRHQTLAIGKKGSNARLAVELTNHRVDVLSIDSAKEAGIEIEWNGNVSPEEVAIIESGERLVRQRRENSAPANNFAQNDLIMDITDFAESMESVSTDVVEEKNDFEIQDDMFSEDELKQMEANFDFDSEFDIQTEEEYQASIEENEDF